MIIISFTAGKNGRGVLQLFQTGRCILGYTGGQEALDQSPHQARLVELHGECRKKFQVADSLKLNEQV